MQVTIRFENVRNSHESAVRAIGSVLLEKEAKTAKMLIGGFYFEAERSPQEIFNDFYEDGFIDDDFASVEFKFNA